MKSFLEKEKEGFYKLKVWVQPNAKKNEIDGEFDGCLKVKIKAPPVEGKANKELLRFLCKILGVKSKNLEIKTGEKSRKKVILIKTKDLKFDLLKL